MSEAVRLALVHPHGLLGDLLAREMTAQGLVVVSVHRDPLELERAYAAQRFEVAVLDLEPNAQSAERVAHLSRRLGSVGLVVSSAGLDPQSLERWRRAGARGYVHRVISGLPALVAAVRAVASGRTAFPEALPDPPRARGRPTARELEVLGYVALGIENATIGNLLGIRERTVKAHVSSLYKKLGQENRTQLALAARSFRLPSPFGRWR